MSIDLRSMWMDLIATGVRTAAQARPVGVRVTPRGSPGVQVRSNPKVNFGSDVGCRCGGGK